MASPLVIDEASRYDPPEAAGGVSMILKSLAALAAGLFCAAAAAAAPVAWVQMVAGGAEVRLVTDEATCPDVRVDGRRVASSLRAPPTGLFPGRVCFARLPPGVRSIEANGLGLPVPRAPPSRLVVIGDTGCRLKGPAVQHCNDPSGWPFARVAALAARHKPDLVIHDGDYYYRETACPDGVAACAGSPHGDRWATWKAELFDPAAPLLAAAPWVFARGNHEDCQRGGAGWFRLLDAGPSPLACPAESETFDVPLGGLRLFVVDSADSDDRAAPASLVAGFVARLALVRPRPGESAWIVTHRPVWNVLRLGGLLSDGLVNATERAAARQGDLAGVALVVSGHVHNFASLSFGAGRPAQLVVGTGGDTLALDAAPPPASGAPMVDGLPARAFAMGRFGYFVFDRDGSTWRGAFHDLTDRTVATCRLKARSLTCKAT